MKARFSMVVALVAFGCGPAAGPDIRPGQEPSPELVERATSAFHTLRDGFLEWYYEADPVRASELGLVAYDDRLTELDRASVQRRIDALLDWDAQLRRIPGRFMRGEDRYDYAILEYGIRGELLDLEEIRWWAVDPVYSLELIGRAVSTLVDHRAPGVERSEALRSRLEAAPSVLASARGILRSPAAAWTELAVERAAELVSYMEALPDVVAAEPGGAATVAEVGPAAERLAAALRSHGEWLEEELAPVSTGDFRLGPYLISRKLLYEEHIDLPVSEMDRLNERAVAEYRGEAEAAAREIDPGPSARAVLDSLAVAGPRGGARLPFLERAVRESRDWTVGSGLVTVRESRPPAVREAPLFRGAVSVVLRTPGPFAPAPDPAYLEFAVGPETYVSEAWLRAAALHAAYPGQHVQRLHERDVESELRRVFPSRALAGGWAHYAEAMAVAEGFGTGDPALRLAHAQRALVRQARWFAALQLHVAGRPLDEVASRVAEMAYLDPARARREVQRLTRDPMAVADALGGVQIDELRTRYEEYVAEQEGEFDPRTFHDQLLRLGLPLPLATEALMPAPERPARAERR